MDASPSWRSARSSPIRELQSLLPDAPRKSVSGAVHHAIRVLEPERSRTLRRVRRVGYRMIEALEHEDAAREQHKRARRSLARARRKVESADRALLSSADRRRFDAMEDHLRRQADMLKRLEERQDRVEQRVGAIEKENSRDCRSPGAARHR